MSGFILLTEDVNGVAPFSEGINCAYEFCHRGISLVTSLSWGLKSPPIHTVVVGCFTIGAYICAHRENEQGILHSGCKSSL